MTQGRNRKSLWSLWLVLTLALAGTIGAALYSLGKPQPNALDLQLRALLLPGSTTHGHHQIELACNACHSKAFPDREEVQQSCETCHAAALKEARDTHPKSKFTDPRNAERAALLDATWCVTCHVEHKPHITIAAGVTLPADYCVICHEEVAKDRPSHQDMAFNTCTNSGCHSYHDNTALYEDFLLKHGHGDFLTPKPEVPARDFREVIEELGDYPSERYPVVELGAGDADHGSDLRSDDAIRGDWFGTAHARAGVNCSACHVEPGAEGEGKRRNWVEKPTEQVCASCHKPEVEGFLGGLHGMRLGQDLAPMTPADARLPMKKDAAHDALSCTSCHGAHRFDTQAAAVESCLACHDDGHTRNYKASPHYAAWQAETAGTAPAGSGVSCATCHLPRVEFRTPDYVKRVLVQHNQNANLQPSVKMTRSVCLSCHGLGFSLDALADGALSARNFKGRPSIHVNSIEMALERDRASRQSSAATEAAATEPGPAR